MSQAITVRFFGRFAEEVGSEMEVIATPGMTVAHLRDQLASQFAAEQLRGPRVRVAIADVFVNDAFPLEGVGGIDILAPLSGG